MRTVLLLAALLLEALAGGIFSSSAQAQGPRQPPRPPLSTSYWWESKVIVNNLNLSEPQIKQMGETQAAYVGRLMDLRSAVNKAESNLDNIFNQESIDPRKADAAVDDLAHAREDLTRTITQLSLNLRKILTGEQWQQLRDQQSERQANRPIPGRGRRGGPGGSGGPGAGTPKAIPQK